MPSASRHHPTWCSSVHLGRSKYFWTVRAQAPMVPARQTIFFQILGTMIWPQVTSSKNCDQKDVFRSMGLKYLVEIDLGFYPIMRLTDFVRLIWSSRTIPFLTSRSLINFLFNYYSHFSITRKNSHKTQTKQTNRCLIQTKHYPTPRDKDNTKYLFGVNTRARSPAWCDTEPVGKCPLYYVDQWARDKWRVVVRRHWLAFEVCHKTKTLMLMDKREERDMSRFSMAICEREGCVWLPVRYTHRRKWWTPHVVN